MAQNSDPGGGASPSSELQLIDERELARRTTLSRTTLQAMRRAGGGPAFVRLGRRIVYRVVDVEAWIEARTHGRPAAADHQGSAKDER